MDVATITLPPTLELKIDLTDEQFFQVCQNNRDLRFERTASGELVVMPPTGGETGKRNFEIVVQLGIWNRKHNLGVGFDSSTGFKLPNGANRSPDAAWVLQERWEALTQQQRQKFLPYVLILSWNYVLLAIRSNKLRRKCKNILTMAHV
jgi:Uma2 family endonuclease